MVSHFSKRSSQQGHTRKGTSYLAHMLELHLFYLTYSISFSPVIWMILTYSKTMIKSKRAFCRYHAPLILILGQEKHGAGPISSWHGHNLFAVWRRANFGDGDMLCGIILGLLIPVLSIHHSTSCLNLTWMKSRSESRLWFHRWLKDGNFTGARVWWAEQSQLTWVDSMDPSDEEADINSFRDSMIF